MQCTCCDGGGGAGGEGRVFLGGVEQEEEVEEVPSAP